MIPCACGENVNYFRLTNEGIDSSIKKGLMNPVMLINVTKIFFLFKQRNIFLRFFLLRDLK